MYTALVLNDKSHLKLVEKMKHLIPEGWEIIAHHMTINIGNISNGPLARFPKAVGTFETLVVSSWAMDDRVLAVGVEGVTPSTNKIKHITIAVNRNGGGKPFHSNELTNWQPISDPFSLRGQILEVK